MQKRRWLLLELHLSIIYLQQGNALTAVAGRWPSPGLGTSLCPAPPRPLQPQMQPAAVSLLREEHGSAERSRRNEGNRSQKVVPV